MEAPFVKMQGCGNDFVVFDERPRGERPRGERPMGERPGGLGLSGARVTALADRHTGIGCDQLIAIETPPPGSGADAFMRIRNPDGSEAGACGNATRCVARLLFAETGRREQLIQTVSGILPAMVLDDGLVRVDMGPPRLDWRDIPLACPADTLHLDLAAGPVRDPAAASMGNPHATFFVADVLALDIAVLGPRLEHAALFPEGTNIGFAQVIAPDCLRLRVWERGAGLTLACGSGACAALVNAIRRGLTARRASVLVDGGVLDIEWRRDLHVLMTGPAVTAFHGTIDLAAYPA
jgi:diaminopimelate epimerase